MENITNYITEILILLFIVITFLQSGIDKITDWKGNIGWLKGHFSKTFLAGQVPLMVGIILIIEVIAGLMALVGIFYIISSGQTEIALYAHVLAAVTLLIAKDYAGAFTIVGYFIVVLLGLTMLS